MLTCATDEVPVLCGNEKVCVCVTCMFLCRNSEEDMFCVLEPKVFPDDRDALVQSVQMSTHILKISAFSYMGFIWQVSVCCAVLVGFSCTSYKIYMQVTVFISILGLYNVTLCSKAFGHILCQCVCVIKPPLGRSLPNVVLKTSQGCLAIWQLDSPGIKALQGTTCSVCRLSSKP